MDDIRKSQRDLCIKFGSPFVESHAPLKIGLSRNFDMHKYPINGMRHPPERDTTGWYIWSGEWSDSPDFFEPHHLYRLYSQDHELVKYLGLAPGWRFADPPYDAAMAIGCVYATATSVPSPSDPPHHIARQATR